MQNGVHRRHGRALYKELLKYAQAHPDTTKRARYITQIRKDFHRHWGKETDEKTADALLKKASSRLGYLRMQVPSSAIPIRYRMRHDRPNRNDITQTLPNDMNTTFSVSNETGKVAASVSRVIQNAKWTNWRDGNTDPDEKRKHESHLERFVYKGPYWEKRRRGWLPQETIDIWKGPTYTDYLMDPDNVDIAVDMPTAKLDDHPMFKDDPMIDMAMRKDFGIDEQDVTRYEIKKSADVTPQEVYQSARDMHLIKERDKIEGAPTPTEFLRGRREK